MNEPRAPMLNQLNLIVRDVPAALAFYRRLGLDIEEASHPDWARHHATVTMANGMRLELDSLEFATQSHYSTRSAATPGHCRGLGRNERWL